MADFEELDISVIKGHKWAEELRTTLLTNVDRYILNWCQVVIQLGEDEVELNKWVDIFKSEIDEKCKELVIDVVDMKAKVVDNITELLGKMQKYSQQLGMRGNLSDISPNEKLYQVERSLMEQTNKLETLIQEKQVELKTLVDKQSKLCGILNERPLDLPKCSFPSQSELEELQKHIEFLEQEKFNREEKYLVLKEDIGRMVAELELFPKSDFERDLLNTTQREFDISDRNMRDVQKFHDELVQQLTNMKEEITNLRQTVGDLWTILEESISERDSFNDRFAGYSTRTLKALKAEVKRCEELKKANIKIFVEKLRTELFTLWKTCYHQHQEEVGDYPWLTSDFYTEDMLFYHERELTKWKIFYSKNEELIKLFSQHEKLWHSLLTMEKESAGTQRYKNRGGQLLKEEKERNKLAKKIPLVEEKIKTLATDYLECHGTPFLIFGVPILEYLDQLYEKRDQDRKEKLTSKKQVKERQLTTPAKSYLSFFPSSSKSCITPQPLSGIKRKILKPLTTGNKMKTTDPAKSTLTSISKTALSRAKRLSTEKNKRIMKCRKQLVINALKDDPENLSNLTNYDKFERNLTFRQDNCSSTVCHPEPNPPRNGIPIIEITPGTPSKTIVASSSHNQLTPSGCRKLTRAPSNLKIIF